MPSCSSSYAFCRDRKYRLTMSRSTSVTGVVPLLAQAEREVDGDLGLARAERPADDREPRSDRRHGLDSPRPGRRHGRRHEIAAASAMELNFVSSESAREVRTTGRARAHDHRGQRPRLHEAEDLVEHVAGLDVGQQQHVGDAGHRAGDPLVARRLDRERVVERERAVHDAALDLAAVGHLRQRRRVHRGRHLGIHRLDGGDGRDLGPLDAEPVGQARPRSRGSAPSARGRARCSSRRR